MRRLAILLVITRLVFWTALAHADDPHAGSIVDVDDTTFPVVKVIVSVTDAGGRPLTGLTEQAFAAQETGAPASVTGVQSVVNQQLGLAVVLAIDVSGSMAGTPIVQAKSAAAAFVQSLEPIDQSAVVSFADRVLVRSPLSTNREPALAALNSLAAAGNTALYSGVVDSLGVARTTTLPRTAIILLSDGEDFGGVSTAKREEALAQAAAARIPIYTIGFGLGIDRQFLQDLALQTGGRFLEAPDPSAIPGVYDQISQLLRSQYVVSLRSTAPANAAQRSVSLNVTTAAGVVRLNLDYASRRKIEPPAPVEPASVQPVDSPGQAPAPAATSGQTSGNVLIYALGALIAAGAVLLAWRLVLGWRREQRLVAELEGLTDRATAIPSLPLEPGAVGRQRSIHLIVEGPAGSSRYAVRNEPLTIGSAATCQVRLDSEDGVDSEQARISARDGKLVYHQLSAKHVSRIGNEPVTWAILAAGDEVQIGHYRLRVDAEPDMGR